MAEAEEVRQSLSMDEVNRLYEWEWILLRVTQVDQEGVIIHGEVVEHSRQRSKLNKAVRRMHAQDPDAHIYIFFGGTRHMSGEEWRRALAKATEHIREWVSCHEHGLFVR